MEERSKYMIDGCYPEMSQADINFLISLILHHQPKAILEVGVAAGGTSAHILRHTSKDQILYGIDLSIKHYSQNGKNTGYLVQQFCTPEEQARHKLLLGKDPVEALPELFEANTFDFCLLDTRHCLPGELLQFFAVYPYLKDGAVLAMHDTSLNFAQYKNPNIKGPGYAKYWDSTRILFCSLSSRTKMLSNVDIPNIGAIIIDDLTRSNINSTFFALGCTWYYMPSDELINKYKNFIEKYYSQFCQNIFQNCIKYQKNFFM